MHASRPQRDKLMINDVTSTWQTGNHSDATLNKHSVPTATQSARGKRKQGEGTNRDADEMRKDAGENEGGGQRHVSSWRTHSLLVASSPKRGRRADQTCKGSVRSKIIN